jgi:uncharacterized protein (TIGR00255 family)
MIRSMTGFAIGDAEGSWGRISWELRSVNHRYLDVQFRLPEDFRVIEAELRQLAGATLSRGKVEAQLRYTLAGGVQALEVDETRIDQIKSAIDVIERAWGSLNTPDPMRVLAFNGVLRQQDIDFTPFLEAARSSFTEVVKALDDSRAREGERLQEIIADRCDALATQVTAVRARYPQVRGAWMERLRQRCLELDVEVDSSRLEQELALVGQRLDVDEEMSRLEGHIEEVRSVLGRREAVGRRLDFLMQELNREANTLSSKSQDAEMTRCSVEMKVIIEQMREQVQNIE